MRIKKLPVFEVIVVAAVIGGLLYFSIPKFVESQKYKQIQDIQRTFERICDAIEKDPKILDNLKRKYGMGAMNKSLFTDLNTNLIYETIKHQNVIPINDVAEMILKDSYNPLNEENYRYRFVIIDQVKKAYHQDDNILGHKSFVAFYTDDVSRRDQVTQLAEIRFNFFEFSDISEGIVHFDVSNGLNSSGCIYVERKITR